MVGDEHGVHLRALTVVAAARSGVRPASGEVARVVLAGCLMDLQVAGALTLGSGSTPTFQLVPSRRTSLVPGPVVETLGQVGDFTRLCERVAGRASSAAGQVLTELGWATTVRDRLGRPVLRARTSAAQQVRDAAFDTIAGAGGRASAAALLLADAGGFGLVGRDDVQRLQNAVWPADDETGRTLAHLATSLVLLSRGHAVFG
ncbi:hypothetical protein [Thalassiella azotivora]